MSRLVAFISLITTLAFATPAVCESPEEIAWPDVIQGKRCFQATRLMGTDLEAAQGMRSSMRFAGWPFTRAVKVLAR